MAKTPELTMNMILLSAKIVAKVTRDIEDYEVDLSQIKEEDQGAFKEMLKNLKKQEFEIQEFEDKIIVKASKTNKDLGKTPEEMWN